MQTATFEAARPFCARLAPETPQTRGRIELYYSHDTPIPLCRQVAGTVQRWLGEKDMDRFTMTRHGEVARQHAPSLRRTVIEYRSLRATAIAPHELLHYELQELVEPHCGYIGEAEVQLLGNGTDRPRSYQFTLSRQVWGTPQEDIQDATFNAARVREVLGSIRYTFSHPWIDDDGPFGAKGALTIAEGYMRGFDTFPLKGITVNT